MNLCFVSINKVRKPYVTFLFYRKIEPCFSTHAMWALQTQQMLK